MNRVGARRVTTVVVAASLVLVGCGSGGGSETGSPGAAGFDAEGYFKGKTIQMIVTSSPGGNTDLFGRFMASKLADQIPGHPRIAVTNEGGLGGVGDVYEAPESALVIGATARSSSLYGTSGDPAAKQDPNKLQVIGGLAGEPRAWAVYGDLVGKYKSIVDAEGSNIPFRSASTVGGPGEVESDVFLYSWLCEKLRLNCDYINVADDSSSDINLMVQRGEVNLQGADRLTFMRDNLTQLQKGDAQLLFQYAQTDRNKTPLPDGIEAADLKEMLPPDLRAEYAKILPLISSGLLGNMLWAGPGLPADAVKAVQDAYAKVVGDQKNVDALTSILAGGDTAYDYQAMPLAGQEAIDAYNSSNGVYQENKEFLQGLREKYVALWQ
ncbi:MULTISPECIES: hypothetical protein [unclassified Mycobacterium]|uniref:hypothetical protein n=1 Tax=unclassified Mycobacterium TaxID=2642494 RepID=UPI0029C79B48|nr:MULTISPECIES: hypothetical protein [unclassified Mycobacterium]